MVVSLPRSRTVSPECPLGARGHSGDNRRKTSVIQCRVSELASTENPRSEHQCLTLSSSVSLVFLTHNLEVVGSNLAPATKFSQAQRSLFSFLKPLEHARTSTGDSSVCSAGCTRDDFVDHARETHGTVKAFLWTDFINMLSDNLALFTWQCACERSDCIDDSWTGRFRKPYTDTVRWIKNPGFGQSGDSGGLLRVTCGKRCLAVPEHTLLRISCQQVGRYPCWTLFVCSSLRLTVSTILSIQPSL